MFGFWTVRIPTKTWLSPILVRTKYIICMYCIMMYNVCICMRFDQTTLNSFIVCVFSMLVNQGGNCLADSMYGNHIFRKPKVNRRFTQKQYDSMNSR